MKRDPFTFQVIRDPADPAFAEAFAVLDAYFGPRGEMETRDVIMARMLANSAPASLGYLLRYEMVVAFAPGGSLAAVRDHSVIIDLAAVGSRGLPVVVHLSHILVHPAYRGRRLIEGMEQYPFAAAREALCQGGLSPDLPIVLAAEVEHYRENDQERIRRLKLFKHLGYRPADPDAIPYVQPDFRLPHLIDRDGGAVPVPLILMLWRHDAETEAHADGLEIRHIVASLYEMYGRGMEARHMQAAYATLDRFAPAGTAVALTWDRVHRELADG